VTAEARVAASSPRPALRPLRQAQRAVALALLLNVATASAQQQCDGEPSKRSLPDSRFEDHRDGTVTDRTTKLTWMTCSIGQTWTPAGCDAMPAPQTWSAAQDAAAAVNRSGSHFFSDWRVPQLRELASITEPACANPRTNLRVFPATPAGFYWTSSLRPNAGSDADAYALSFGPQGVELLSKDGLAFVRLVRSSR
jgi:hypothetical protein